MPLLNKKLPQGGARTPLLTQTQTDAVQGTGFRSDVQPSKPAYGTKPVGGATDIKPRPVQKPPVKPGPKPVGGATDVPPGGGASTGGVNTGVEPIRPEIKPGIRPAPPNPVQEDPNVALGANLWGVETLFGRRGLHRVYGPAANRPDPVDNEPGPVDDGGGTTTPPPDNNPPPTGGGGNYTGGNPYNPPVNTTPPPRDGDGDGGRDGDPAGDGAAGGAATGAVTTPPTTTATPGIHLADANATQGSEPWAWHQITTDLPTLDDPLIQADNSFDSQARIRHYLESINAWFNSDATAEYSPELRAALEERITNTTNQLLQQFTSQWGVAYGFAPNPTNATTAVNPTNTGPDGNQGATGGGFNIDDLDLDIGGGR